MTTSRAWSFIPSEVWPPRGLWSNGINIRGLWRCGVERKFVVALAVFGLLFAACGGTTPAAQASPTVTATASAKPTATESPDAVMARLYEAAKSEGKVAIYSSMNTDDAKKVFPVFEAKFPGVKVEHTRASGEVLTTKVVTEKKAGQDLFDVVESNLFEVGYIIDQGYTQKYIVASADDYPAEVKDASGAFIAARLNNDIPGINTTKLPAGVTIKTWKDLCNPALSSNGHRLAQLKYEENKPIVWGQTNPIITDVQGMALANKPPHANAGKLLMEWLTSTEGQKAIQSTGRVPANPKVPPKYPDLNNFAPIFYVSLALRADFDKDQAFWNSTLGVK